MSCKALGLIIPHFFQRTLWYLIASLTLLLSVGCPSSSPDFDSVYTRVRPAQLKGGDPIPPPRGEIILTVDGAIGAANDGNKIVMDVATLEAAGLVEYTVRDPFERRNRLFRGVLMRDLLNLWKVNPDASTLLMVALNDYRIEVPIDMLRQFPVLFALQADGAYMKIEYRGPAMLVFPYGYYKFKRPLSDAYWIWQIKSITVK